MAYPNYPRYKEIILSSYPAVAPGPTPIMIVTLSRPKQNNAFTDVMCRELENVFGLLSSDERVRVIIMTGGGRQYCVGADLEQGFSVSGGKAEDHRDGGGRVSLAIHRCLKPVIGAINGAAVGVGITMTLPMAIRVAYNGAKIGFVFGRRGIVPEAASGFFLPRLIGHSRAMHLVTTGAVYRADDPLLNGLFSETLDKAEAVLPRAIEIAEDVAANMSAVSWAMSRDLIWRAPPSAEDTHLVDSKLLFDLFRGKDNAEGMKSFLEKRPARFMARMERDAPTAWPWWQKVDVSQPKLSKL